MPRNGEPNLYLVVYSWVVLLCVVLYLQGPAEKVTRAQVLGQCSILLDLARVTTIYELVDLDTYTDSLQAFRSPRPC